MYSHYRCVGVIVAIITGIFWIWKTIIAITTYAHVVDIELTPARIPSILHVDEHVHPDTMKL